MTRLTSISQTRISSQACLIFWVQSSTRLRSVTVSRSRFRWICSELMYVSVFKVLMFTLLNVVVTWCKVWFYNVSSLHFLLNSSFSLSLWCQTDASNKISDLTITEYICLTFVKIVSHVKTSRWLSVSIHVTRFASICWRCASHCSFIFNCTFSTCTSDFDLMTELSIYMLIIMLKFFNFLMKCVSSYFSDANVALWVRAHFAQTSCALLSVLQIFLMNLL